MGDYRIDFGKKLLNRVIGVALFEGTDGFGYLCTREWGAIPFL